jgi:hypothetical protein
MNNLKSKIMILGIIFLVLVSIPVLVSAKTGTLNFVVSESSTKEAVPNLNFDVYQIGVKNEQGNFEYSKGFENSNLDIDSFTEDNISIIEQYAVSNAKAIFTKTTNSAGKFEITELQEGVYLFVQASDKDKFAVQTMLVQIPEVDSEQNNNYNLTIKPKVSEIKIDESSNTIITDESELPYTGVLNWPIPVLAIIAIVLFCIGWLKAFTNSKKKLN